MFRPSPWDGLGQLSDGVQEILGADIVANRAVGHCGVEQYREGGAEPLQEIAGQRRECRIARVQRRGESAFGREQFGEQVDPLVSASAGSCPALRAGPASATASIPLSTTALTRSERCGKWRYSVPTPTPARSVISFAGASTPEVAKTVLRRLDQRIDVASRVGAPPSHRFAGARLCGAGQRDFGLGLVLRHHITPACVTGRVFRIVPE